MTITKRLCPSDGKGYILAPKPPKVVQNLGKISFKNCHEAVQIDQRRALNAKMHVVVAGGGGGQTSFFFNGQKWSKSAKMGRPNFAILSPGRRLRLGARPESAIRAARCPAEPCRPRSHTDGVSGPRRWASALRWSLWDQKRGGRVATPLGSCGAVPHTRAAAAASTPFLLDLVPPGPTPSGTPPRMFGALLAPGLVPAAGRGCGRGDAWERAVL